MIVPGAVPGAELHPASFAKILKRIGDACSSLLAQLFEGQDRRFVGFNDLADQSLGGMDDLALRHQAHALHCRIKPHDDCRVFGLVRDGVCQTFRRLVYKFDVECLSLGGVLNPPLHSKLTSLIKPAAGERRQRSDEGTNKARGGGENRGIHGERAPLYG
jgi:hypothetical protein